MSKWKLLITYLYVHHFIIPGHINITFFIDPTFIKKCSGTFLVSNILHLMHKTGRILHKDHLAAQCHKAQAFCTVLWNVRCD